MLTTSAFVPFAEIIRRSVSASLTEPFRRQGAKQFNRHGGAWSYLLCLCSLACLLVGHSACAQTFQTLPALTFTKAMSSTSNPLPQVFTAASTGTNFGFSITTTSTTGGNWLTTDVNGGTYDTPRVIRAMANPDVSLAAGTYTGSIVLKSSTETLTVPVSLIIEPTSLSLPRRTSRRAHLFSAAQRNSAACATRFHP